MDPTTFYFKSGRGYEGFGPNSPRGPSGGGQHFQNSSPSRHRGTHRQQYDEPPIHQHQHLNRVHRPDHDHNQQNYNQNNGEKPHHNKNSGQNYQGGNPSYQQEEILEQRQLEQRQDEEDHFKQMIAQRMLNSNSANNTPSSGRDPNKLPFCHEPYDFEAEEELERLVPPWEGLSGNFGNAGHLDRNQVTQQYAQLPELSRYNNMSQFHAYDNGQQYSNRSQYPKYPPTPLGNDVSYSNAPGSDVMVPSVPPPTGMTPPPATPIGNSANATMSQTFNTTSNVTNNLTYGNYANNNTNGGNEHTRNDKSSYNSGIANLEPTFPSPIVQPPTDYADHSNHAAFTNCYTANAANAPTPIISNTTLVPPNLMTNPMAENPMMGPLHTQLPPKLSAANQLTPSQLAQLTTNQINPTSTATAAIAPVTPTTTPRVTFLTHDQIHQWDEQLDLLKFDNDEFFNLAFYLLDVIGVGSVDSFREKFGDRIKKHDPSHPHDPSDLSDPYEDGILVGDSLESWGSSDFYEDDNTLMHNHGGGCHAMSFLFEGLGVKCKEKKDKIGIVGVGLEKKLNGALLRAERAMTGQGENPNLAYIGIHGEVLDEGETKELEKQQKVQQRQEQLQHMVEAQLEQEREEYEKEMEKEKEFKNRVKVLRRRYRLSEKLLKDFEAAVKFRMERIKELEEEIKGGGGKNERRKKKKDGEKVGRKDDNEVIAKTKEVARKMEAYGLPKLYTKGGVAVIGGTGGAANKNKSDHADKDVNDGAEEEEEEEEVVVNHGVVTLERGKRDGEDDSLGSKSDGSHSGRRKGDTHFFPTIPAFNEDPDDDDDECQYNNYDSRNVTNASRVTDENNSLISNRMSQHQQHKILNPRKAKLAALTTDKNHSQREPMAPMTPRTPRTPMTPRTPTTTYSRKHTNTNNNLSPTSQSSKSTHASSKSSKSNTTTSKSKSSRSSSRSPIASFFSSIFNTQCPLPTPAQCEARLESLHTELTNLKKMIQTTTNPSVQKACQKRVYKLKEERRFFQIIKERYKIQSMLESLGSGSGSGGGGDDGSGLEGVETVKLACKERLMQLVKELEGLDLDWSKKGKTAEDDADDEDDDDGIEDEVDDSKEVTGYKYSAEKKKIRHKNEMQPSNRKLNRVSPRKKIAVEDASYDEMERTNNANDNGDFIGTEDDLWYQRVLQYVNPSLGNNVPEIESQQQQRQQLYQQRYPQEQHLHSNYHQQQRRVSFPDNHNHPSNHQTYYPDAHHTNQPEDRMYGACDLAGDGDDELISRNSLVEQEYQSNEYHSHSGHQRQPITPRSNPTQTSTTRNAPRITPRSTPISTPRNSSATPRNAAKNTSQMAPRHDTPRNNASSRNSTPRNKNSSATQNEVEEIELSNNHGCTPHQQQGASKSTKPKEAQPKFYVEQGRGQAVAKAVKPLDELLSYLAL